MQSLIEDVSIDKLGALLDDYNKEKEISVDCSLLEMFNKGKEELYRFYLEGIELKIIVKKVSTFSSISAYDIQAVFPLEASYILSYIVNNTSIKKSTNIKVLIYDESKRESSLYAAALNTATNINLTFDDNKISPVAMDKYYNVNKEFILNAKKTFFGTMLDVRSSKYFQAKKNETGLPLSIEELIGESKNYLKPKEDELLIIYCPICKEQKKFLYSEINEYFNLTKDELSVICTHIKSEYMYQPPHKIVIENELVMEIKNKTYKKEDIFMWIVNNRKYFELFGK
jgi:hypothetical protein